MGVADELPGSVSGCRTVHSRSIEVAVGIVALVAASYRRAAPCATFSPGRKNRFPSLKRKCPGLAIHLSRDDFRSRGDRGPGGVSNDSPPTTQGFPRS
jgi:hypothetical protein